MSTSTPESRELLRLYKCVVETGTGVLTAFAQNKLLAAYNGNFKQFLDDKKHELFHLWQSKKLSCCECPPAGYNFKRMSHMDNWILKKLYADNGPENRSHILRNGRDVVQVCLHKYVTRSIAIHELDISAISFLLRNLIILSANETTTLDIITTTRSKICHAYSINCYTMTLLNSTWTELENALVDLTDPSYKWSTRQQIKYLRKIDLEKEEITELLSNVEEVLQEVKSSSNNNVAYLNGMETRLRNKSINNTDAINQHTTKETSYQSSQAQQALSEKIKNTEENLKKEVIEVKKSQETSYQKIGTELLETRSDIKEVMENQEKTQVEMVKMSRTIQNLKMFIKYERPNVLVPVAACPDAMERPVLWQIATPEHWNLEDVEATLRSPSQKDELFKIKFVKKGSLIMLTTIAASVLGDPEAFEAAVMSFLTNMIEDCDINTEIPSRVDVRLHILNANEVSISCERPLEVRNEQASVKFINRSPNIAIDNKAVQTEDAEDTIQMRLEKRWKELEKFDVAFLNGDNEKEIKWVQNTSRILEDKFDMKCAILAEESMYGFPLKRRIRQYFNRFYAVIITLTKENYGEYDGYTDYAMPIIAVELEYLNAVQMKIQKCRYINCSVCEHLWLPRLINVLRTKLPEHLRQKIEKPKIEIDEDCEKCKTEVITTVHHIVTLRKESDTKKVILYASLADEGWILNFFQQMLSFTQPYLIIRWIKLINISSPLDTNTKFVLVSTNSEKCESLKTYGNSVRSDKTVAIKISNIESQTFNRLLIKSFDATSMKQEHLAQMIFASADFNITQRTSFQVLGKKRRRLSRPGIWLMRKQVSHPEEKTEDNAVNQMSPTEEKTEAKDVYQTRKQMSHPEEKTEAKGEKSPEETDKLEEPIF